MNIFGLNLSLNNVYAAADGLLSWAMSTERLTKRQITFFNQGLAAAQLGLASTAVEQEREVKAVSILAQRLHCPRLTSDLLTDEDLGGQPVCQH
ncbi:MAG: hypothetical protein D3909_18320 [Candidatus Electrothrix sp. ATG1]|nr:hypothetical protein [Candidatus Electrothrix sp. ATG1]